MHTFKWLNSSICPIDLTLKSTTTPDQSESGSNGNEGVLHIPQSPASDAVFCHTQDTTSVWPIDRTQTSFYTLVQGWPGNNGNVGVFHIPLSSRTGASLSDTLVISWKLVGGYPSAEMQLADFTAPADCAYSWWRWVGKYIIINKQKMMRKSVLWKKEQKNHCWIWAIANLISRNSCEKIGFLRNKKCVSQQKFILYFLSMLFTNGCKMKNWKVGMKKTIAQCSADLSNGSFCKFSNKLR